MTDLKRIGIELITFFLIIGFYLLFRYLIMIYLWQVDIFKAGVLLGVIICALLDGTALYYLGKNFLANFVKQKGLPDSRFLFLSIALTFVVVINITGGICVFMSDNLQRVIWIYYISPMLLIPFIYLIMLFWKWYNWRLADQKEGVVDRGFHIIRLLALVGLLPTLIVCSITTIFLLFQFIFS